jgi:hypothetical protein
MTNAMSASSRCISLSGGSSNNDWLPTFIRTCSRSISSDSQGDIQDSFDPDVLKPLGFIEGA